MLASLTRDTINLARLQGAASWRIQRHALRAIAITKCNSQCTNFILFDVALLPVHIKEATKNRYVAVYR